MADSFWGKEFGMNPTKNTLPKTVRSKVIALFNDILASCTDAMLNAKQAHWNVKGPQFFALHELFDDISENLEEATDLIAERIVQLGGFAEGTAPVVAKKTKLKEYPLSITDGRAHVEYLSDSLARLGQIVREGIDSCNEWGDADAADILTGVSRGIDKYLWFVEAHLQGQK